MLQEFKEFTSGVEQEVTRSRWNWRQHDKKHTIIDFVLILQTQVGQLSERVLGKGSREAEQEAIHVAAMAYEVYRKAREK